MPKIFNTDKITLVEYGNESEQVFSLSKVANDVLTTLRKLIKQA